MASADAGCVLKVDARCEACKMKIVEVLGSIIGVYNVNIDGQEGLVMISGEVDPNILLRALARTGRHAELVRVNLKHPQMSRSNHSHGYGYGSVESPFGNGFNRNLPDHAYAREFFPSMMGMGSDYPFRRSNYGCGMPRRPAAGAGYMPTYNRRGYYPYNDGPSGYMPTYNRRGYDAYNDGPSGYMPAYNRRGYDAYNDERSKCNCGFM